MTSSPTSKPSPRRTPTGGPSGPADVNALAALNEPLRRRLYEHAASSENGVSRDGAADAIGVPRSVAAFHLDKLVDVGLLEAEYRRPPGRGGPGAGRPAKWYRRSDLEFGCAVPARRYHVAAALLAEAISHTLESDTPLTQALRDAARRHGRTLGADLPPGATSPELTVALAATLAREGYEPRIVESGTVESGMDETRRAQDRSVVDGNAATGAYGSTITLGNCPFHALAETHRTLVCSMNHEIFCGLARAAGLPEDAARLDADADRCCVVLHVPPPAATPPPR